jgi:hypothetical protein
VKGGVFDAGAPFRLEVVARAASAAFLILAAIFKGKSVRLGEGLRPFNRLPCALT